MERFSVTLVQMAVGPDREANHARAEEEVRRAAAAGARLVVLPEMFSCPYEADRFHELAEPLPDGPSGRLCSRLARELGIHLVGGSIPEREGDRVWNTATLWDPEGRMVLRHRKVHLFDVDIPGGIRFTESAVLAPGNEISVARTSLGTIGLAVCYDLRFPELFRAMALRGAELVVLPGAFNTTTGPAHWEVLNRARAIENTMFIASCSPAPHPRGTYPAWGHSMVVDPWGTVLAAAGREETSVGAELDPDRLAEVRRALPVLRQRRPDLYGDPGGAGVN